MRRSLDVLTVLAKSDLRLRYGRGSMRLLKWLLDPLAALGVYLLLISLVLDQGGRAVGLSIACAVVPFHLIATTMSNALQSVTVRASIILNMRFPRILIPASALVTESIAYPATLLLLPVMMAVYGVGPTVHVLWLPLAILTTACFALALAYPCALLGVWYPELQPFVGSVLRALFFLAPGLVALEQVSARARDVLPLNPLTGVFEGFRDALLYGRAPAAWEFLVPLAASAVILAVALPVYLRDQPYLGKLVG